MALNSSDERREYLPSCWGDELRMNAMFTVFRSRDVNPNGWQEKMNFWTDCILQFCHVTGRVSIIANEIPAVFQRNRREPKCINEVIDNMNKEGTILSSTHFKLDAPSGWLGWGYSVLKKPVLQSYSLVKSMLFDSTAAIANGEEAAEKRYVVPEVLKVVTGKVMARQKELERRCDIESIIELNDFKSLVSDICYSSEDFDIVLVQLRREGKVAVMVDGGECYLKFKSDDSSEIQPISEVDKAIVKLRKASDTVYTEIEALEKEMDKCVIEAKEFLKVGNKVKAMVCLKRKKRIETALKKKTISGENLENLMMQLKSTGSEKLILQAYSAGVDAMKNRVKVDYNIDRIDTIMNDLEEAVGDVSEISAIMSKSFDDDTSDIEAELDALLAEDAPSVRRQPEQSADEMHEELMKRLISLKVPDGSPTKEQLVLKTT